MFVFNSYIHSHCGFKKIYIMYHCNIRLLWICIIITKIVSYLKYVEYKDRLNFDRFVDIIWINNILFYLIFFPSTPLSVRQKIYYNEINLSRYYIVVLIHILFSHGNDVIYMHTVTIINSINKIIYKYVHMYRDSVHACVCIYMLFMRRPVQNKSVFYM